MARLSVWLGAGAVTAGVSAALVAGADVANADTTSGSDGPKTSESTSSASPSSKGDRAGPRRSFNRTRHSAQSTDAAHAVIRKKATKPAKTAVSRPAPETEPGASSRESRAAQRKSALANFLSKAEPSSAPDTPAASVETAEPVRSVTTAVKAVETGEQQAAPPMLRDVFKRAAAPYAASVPQAVAPISPVSATAAPSLSLPEQIQSFVFDFVGVAVTTIAGPPRIPAGSNVTVRSSSLEITEGRNVPADWYYPEGDEAPERIILLQHGFLGVSAMYSYTAANLAERTNSVVVVPTYSSNRFVRDGFWLGDDQVYRATAELFLGDRDALTASANAAGYAARYGDDVPLPETFVLIGHSLGAGVVAGAAGYYADAIKSTGAENHLAGVVLLDGAPPEGVLPDALDKLDGLGAYVPVLELGAPKEVRRVDAALIEHRPDMFNGVVLADGQHLDAMQGGSPLIQLLSYLFYGFSTAPNKVASQTLISGWVDDMFAGRIDASTGACEGDDCSGIYGEPGQTLNLPTPAGPTRAVVIGGAALAPITTAFQPMLATASVAPRPPSDFALIQLL
ncbi:hypothetical protein A5779_03480 [Mycolicibacterium peregrinum]|uniref:Uncharacterized protein n=1 Tax=Mycolicibacterium peregrinum TaxID=43304 RepID=A0A1A0VRB5_MYCPR|nr:hypothetical protein A5779_03480 [Mycolicibacterium peregrinum]